MTAAPPAPTAATDLADLRRTLGDRYAIERLLGRGGMGAVYLARDLRLDRQVALKVLPGEFASQAALRERFLLETRTAASFSHPNIVPVYAVEDAGELLAYAMGFVEGETLAEKVRRAGPLPVRELVRLLQDVGYALAYAHGRGVVHRDIKPDNIMIERATGRALVMDFGISRSISAPAHGTAALTRVGEVVGSPEYMSPEQASGDVVDGRSDLYALGLTAHFAATGRVAITGESTQKILVRQLTEEVPPIAASRQDLPAALAEAIDRCVVKDPAGRWERAEALVEAIDAAQLATPEIPLPVRLYAGELGTLSFLTVSVGVVIFFMLRMATRGGRIDYDLILLINAFIAILITRVMTTLSEAGRLAEQGFTPDAILTGMARAHAEREERRVQLRADERVRQRRRSTVRVGALLLAAGVTCFVFALRTRVALPTGGWATSAVGIALFATGAPVIATALVLLLRNPLRPSPAERLYGLVWLGPIGRAFVRFGARSAKGASSAGVTAPRATAPRAAATAAAAAPAPPAASAAPARDRLADLEARVTELERWRDDGGRR